jgi:hypothetical protein
MQNKVFISYSRKDSSFAQGLASDLESLGAQVWIDVDDIPVGTRWSKAVQNGLDESEVLLLVISPDAMVSPNVEDEWQYFHEKRKRIIPLLWREAELHFQLVRLQRVDFRKGIASYRQALRELVGLLNELGMSLRLPEGLNMVDPDESTMTFRKQLRRIAEKNKPTAMRNPALSVKATVPLSASTRPRHRRWLVLVLGLLVVGLIALFFSLADTESPGVTALPPTTQAPSVTASVPNLRLVYDSQAVYIQNISETEVDISGLRFVRVGADGKQYEFSARAWAQGSFTGRGSIYRFTPGTCFQLSADSRRADQRPAPCAALSAWLYRSDRVLRFWVSEEAAAQTFSVQRGGETLAECSLRAGLCEFRLDVP